MRPTLGLLGVAGFLFGISAAWLILQIRNHFNDHFDIAVRMFFLDEDGLKAFKVLTTSTMVVVGSLLLQTIAESAQMYTVRSVGHFLTILGLGGVMYFYLLVYRITKKPGDRNSE